LPLLAGFAFAIPATISALAADDKPHAATWKDWWLPSDYSVHGPSVDWLFNVIFWITMVIFVAVEILLVYFAIKYRFRPERKKGIFSHGNTRLEIAWTLIPTIIVLFAGGYSWKVLDDIEDPVKDHLTVSVFSQQYAWSFAYPGKGYVWSEGELHVPVGRQVQFKMHAMDVIHSFWVPEWRIKKDNVPGITTTAIVTPDKEGSYQLVCTELCGFGHATMRAKVVVESPSKFKKWVESLETPLPDPFMDVLKEGSVTNPPALGAGGA